MIEVNKEEWFAKKLRVLLILPWLIYLYPHYWVLMKKETKITKKTYLSILKITRISHYLLWLHKYEHAKAYTKHGILQGLIWDEELHWQLLKELKNETSHIKWWFTMHCYTEKFGFAHLPRCLPDDLDMDSNGEDFNRPALYCNIVQN